MSTPHINAKPEDFADTVIMPGDPLRAKYIAENYLTDAVCVNEVRGMLAYTGLYNGKRISVMGSGMGIPSMSIYATELFKEFGVKNIIRIGSCGAVRDDIKVRDVIIGMGASTDSNVNRQRFQNYDFAAIADYELLEKAVNTAKTKNIQARVGNVFTADLFYTPNPEMFAVMEKHGVLAVEMEAAGLYGVAAEFGGKALAIFTVSDHIKTGEVTTAEERQNTFNDMIVLALDSFA